MRRPWEPGVVVFTIGGVVDRAGIPALCERLRVLLETSASDTVLCDVERLRRVDVTVVDALARFLLIVRRSGRQFRLRHASVELQDLLGLMGLSEVVPLEAALAVQAEGQTEEREEIGGIEEEADPGDPTS